MPPPPKAIQPSVLTRLAWRLIGSPSAMPKPPRATRPSAFTRLRWRLFGSPTDEPKPPQAIQTFFLWRFFRAIFFRLRIHVLFESNGDGIPPRYWRTRDWRRLLWGVPALLILIGTAGLGIAVARLDNGELARSNLSRAEELAATNNEREALIHAEAACKLNPNDPNNMMALAWLCEWTGNGARQKAIVLLLAPNDRIGYPPAHLMLAHILLRESPTTRSYFSADAERHLLLIANQEGSQGIEASLLLGENYLNAGKMDRAIPFLRRAPVRSEARVLLAEALALHGKALGIPAEVEEAEAEATSCGEMFETQLKSNPADVRARFYLAQCLRILKKYWFAISVCEQGIALNPPRGATEKLVDCRNETFFDWLMFLEADKQSSLAQRFDVLEKALVAAPSQGEFLQRLLALTDPTSQEGIKARTMLEERLTKGLNKGLAHYVLGLYAWYEGDQDKNEADRQAHQKSAGLHLESAQKSMPFGPQVERNLAWILANTNPPGLPGVVGVAGGAAAVPFQRDLLKRALSLVDSAIKRGPSFVEFWHTRGCILMKMERWNEAIHDLEMAEDVHADQADQADVHAALAVAYAKIGDQNLSALHWEAAKPKKK
jgi:tetratricopeptide (TPR) repeat protein